MKRSVKKFTVVSVAVVAVLLFAVTVFAQGTYQYPFGTLNGIFNIGATTATTNSACRTFSGYPAASRMVSVRVTGRFNNGCPNVPITPFVQITDQNGNILGQAQVNTSTNGFNVTIPLQGNPPTNGTFCIRGYATRTNTTALCAISITNGVAYFNYN